LVGDFKVGNVPRVRPPQRANGSFDAGLQSLFDRIQLGTELRVLFFGQVLAKNKDPKFKTKFRNSK
jgi:hypothetical protein